MAANPKKLRIVDAHLDNPSTRVLAIECVEGEPFARVGGKYVIVHTGIVVDGKSIKRAYSMMPVANAPGRAWLTVKRLGAGVGSNALHDAPVGTELLFSGPWGKLLPEEEAITEPTLVVATDTGITAALGVAEQTRTRPAAAVLWLRAEDETFLDVGGVRERAGHAGARFAVAPLPPVGDAGRVQAATPAVEALLAETGATLVIAAGDGAVIHPLRDRLVNRVREVRLESFFQNPEKRVS